MRKTDGGTFEQLIVKHATDSMLFTDSRGLTLWVNEPFTRMSGYQLSDLAGKKPGALLQGKDTNPKTVKEISQAIEANKTIRTELLNYAKDGKPYWIDLTISPVYDDAGTLTHYMSVERDITKSKDLIRATKEALAEETERRRERKVLSQMSQWLFAAQSLDELRRVITRSMPQLFPDTNGELFIYSNSRDVLDLVGYWGEEPKDQHLQADQCWALRRGRAYSFGTSEIDFACDHVDSESSPYFCLPIIAHGDTIGLMHIAFPDLLSMRDQSENMQALLAPAFELAQICAEQVSLAAANVRLQTELQDRSVKDALTGLWNRRWFLDMANREIRRAHASGAPLALVMLDVDHFKKFNDSHGHDAGDAVLKILAAHLSDIRTEAVFPCRIGGEEFALLCSNADAEHAKHVVHTLQEMLAETQIVHSGTVLPNVTISAGVSDLTQGEELEGLMKRADEALYAAKDAGRNRVIKAELPSTSANEKKAVKPVEAPTAIAAPAEAPTAAIPTPSIVVPEPDIATTIAPAALTQEDDEELGTFASARPVAAGS
ncbi:MAG: diguanylate cyclase [Pseudomonadota bacterium]